VCLTGPYKHLLKLLITRHFIYHSQNTTKHYYHHITATRPTYTANMATAETVTLSEAHAPLQGSIDAFNSILPSLKHELTKLRRDHDSPSPLSPSSPIY
jgi:hypothetical protein